MTDIAAEILAANPALGEFSETLPGGLSDSSVHVLVKGQDRRVLKVQEDPVEHHFYTQIVDRHLGDKDWLPQIYATGEWGRWNWIVLEHVPNGWPRERFSFDKAALSVLSDLHATKRRPATDSLADHTWTRAQLAVAKKYLPAKTGEQLDRVFDAYEARRTSERVLCSGDPNAPNWLIRDDGSIVLVDWQQVTIDHPALDIAGWLASMLTFSEMLQVSSRYLRRPFCAEVARFARDVFVFFCRRCATNFWRAEISTRPELWRVGNERMKRSFPGWLDSGIRESEIVGAA